MYLTLSKFFMFVCLVEMGLFSKKFGIWAKAMKI